MTEQLKKLFEGLLPTIGIPLLFAFTLYLFGITFWGCFLLLFLLQFPVLSLYRKSSELAFLHNKKQLEDVREKNFQKEFELFIRKTTPVVCPSCKSLNNFHIEIDNERNVHKCEKCNQEIICMVEIIPVIPTKFIDTNKTFTVKDFEENIK